jgi:hypothetical protein
MSDTVPAAPAPSATVTPITDAPKTHHSATQPRADGKFNGPPGSVPPVSVSETTPPPAPRWKVGDEEFDDPAELARVATERTVDRRATEQHYRKAQELEQKAAALEAALEAAKRGESLDAEAERRIALRVAQRYQQEQEEAALPEEERQIRRQWREMQAREASARAELEKYKKEKADAETKQKQEVEQRAQQELRQNLGNSIRTAMQATGLPMNDDLTRMVIAEMEAGFHSGVEYPPDVLARKVQRRFYSAANEVVTKEKPEVLFKRMPGLVEVLNALEDPAILRQLAPKLGDRLRRLALTESGLRPTVVPSPTGPVSPGLPRAEDLKPGDPRWEQVLRERTRR